MSKTITTRVEDSIVIDLDLIAREERLDRSAAIRRLLIKSVEEWKIEYALDKYSHGKVSLWQAAELAEVPLVRMMDFLVERNIPVNYTLEDLEDDFRMVSS